MVDGQSVFADQISDAGRGCQATDPDPAVVARSERPTVRRQRCRDLLPPHSRTDPDPTGRDIADLEVVQSRQIDDNATVIGGTTADTVATTSYAQRDFRVVAGEGEGVDHL